LQSFGRTELSNDGGGGLVLGVDGEAEAADVGGGELLVETPGRALGPVAQGFGGPGGGFIRVTGRAGIWDFVLVCHGRGDEGKSVSANFDVGDSGLDLWHVAGDALASRSAGLVMGVLFERGGAGSVERHGAVAIETKFVGRLS
jgi:hypothetical protein